MVYSIFNFIQGFSKKNFQLGKTLDLELSFVFPTSPMGRVACVCWHGRGVCVKRKISKPKRSLYIKSKPTTEPRTLQKFV